MGCTTCGSGGCSSGGCGQNGGCATGGCNKLNTFDWLGNMLPPDRTEVDNIYEVRFKNTRKEFFRNVNGLRLYTGDAVILESDRGFDLGHISLGGVMAELQMKKKGVRIKRNEIPRIFRKANEQDLEALVELRKQEPKMTSRAREIVRDLNLDMKLSDVEFQGDGTKAIFYYIADHRVDFRELIKILAREFRIRVEMKQIGLRHEAGLLGGIGACGRELCCSTWLTEFKTVSTSAARYQNLSLNPMKISGLCGRLKCCLNFELESYMDALKDFPKTEKIMTEKGIAFLQKTDIFKGTMWFSYPDETTWYPLEVEEVKRLMEMNENGTKPESLAVVLEQNVEKSIDFVDVVGTNVPTMPDRQQRRRNKNTRGRKKGAPQNSNQSRSSESPKNKRETPGSQGGEKPDEQRPNQRRSGSRGRGRGPRRGPGRKPGGNPPDKK